MESPFKTNNLFKFELCNCGYDAVEYYECVLKVEIGSFPAGTTMSRIRFSPMGNTLSLFDDTDENKMDYGRPVETVSVNFLVSAPVMTKLPEPKERKGP